MRDIILKEEDKIKPSIIRLNTQTILSEVKVSKYSLYLLYKEIK
jgi:hypothetical protein